MSSPPPPADVPPPRIPDIRTGGRAVYVNEKNKSGGLLMTRKAARRSIQNLHQESVSLSPTALLELFEIDLSDILTPDRLKKREAFNTFNKVARGTVPMDVGNPKFNVFRFHNNIKLVKRGIWFQGNYYTAWPIQSEGFETNSNGVAATPKLSLGVRTGGMGRFRFFKELLEELDDLVGARIIRIRTFAKFVDWRNWYETNPIDHSPTTNPPTPLYEDIPIETFPDENAYFPPDIYYIDKKSYEDKSTLQFELASYVNFEEMKLPRRIFNENRCPWHYRGEGCCYEYNLEYYDKNPWGPPPKLGDDELYIDNANSHKAFRDVGGASDYFMPGTFRKPYGQPSPQKFGGMFFGAQLPVKAPPVATHNDELISDIIPGYSPTTAGTPTRWLPEKAYPEKSVVFLVYKKRKYYFVSKKAVPKANPPPDTEYWVADQCSKTITGCKFRWQNPEIGFESKLGGPMGAALPFGGFPALKKRDY